MQLVKQKAEIIERSESKINNIANIARICYKSENKADDERNKRLVENLIKNKHFAMLEHEDYILYFDNVGNYNDYCRYVYAIEKYFGVKLHLIICGNNIISGNVRAWRNYYKYVKILFEKKYIVGDIKYISVPLIFDDNIFFDDILNNDGHFALNINNKIKILKPEELTNKYDIMAHCRISAKFITDRGISHELVRHRNFSFAQESTRYVNYNKKGVQFINYSEYVSDDTAFFDTITGNNIYSSRRYNRLIENGNSPQLARAVLPHNLKTEIVMTGNVRAWLHFFNLRLFEKTGKAHPMIKELAEQLYNEFENKTPISKKLIESYCNEMWELENE